MTREEEYFRSLYGYVQQGPDPTKHERGLSIRVVAFWLLLVLDFGQVPVYRIDRDLLKMVKQYTEPKFVQRVVSERFCIYLYCIDQANMIQRIWQFIMWHVAEPIVVHEYCRKGGKRTADDGGYNKRNLRGPSNDGLTGKR